jgi:hypothetical protein
MSHLPPDANDVRALLEEAAYIDDAGFSARVVRSLPRRRLAKVLSLATVPLFATIACAIAFTICGPIHASMPLHHGFSLATMAPFLVIAFVVVLVASATLLPADE